MQKKGPSLSKNFVVYFLKTVVVTFVPMITFPYASRVLGPTGVGRVQYAQTWASYFQMFACLGITSYATREGTRCRDDKNKLGKLCTELFRINCVTTLIAYIAYFIFIFCFPKVADYRGLLLICGIMIAGNALSIEWLYAIFEDYTYISVRSIILQLLSLVLLVVLVRNRTDYYQYALVLILPVALAACLNLAHSRKVVHWGGYRDYHYLKHIKPIVLIFGITMATAVYGSMDTTMLGLHLGDEAVGYYTAASKLCRNVLSVVVATCAVFAPRAYYYANHENRDKFFELTKTTIHLLLIFSIPCAVGMIILAPEFMVIFSGPEFLVAIEPMKVLSINIICTAITNLLSWQILVTMNKEHLAFITTIQGCIIDFVLNSLLIPRYGVMGAAIATFIAEFSVLVSCIFFCKNLMPLRFCFNKTWQYILAAVSFFPIRYLTSFFEQYFWLELLATILLCVLTYFGILYLLKNDFLFFLLSKAKTFFKKNKGVS